MICAVSPASSKPGLCVMHVTASPCFGGTERQMLELGLELRGWCRSVYVSFQEEGRCWGFVNEAARQGWAAHALRHDTPRLLAALGELKSLARRAGASLLVSHGYKANLLGFLAARRLGIPVVSVSHGWTAESLRVRLFEVLDRRVLRRMDKVVCVSEGQAKKVLRSGVPDAKVQVIHDAVRCDRFSGKDPEYRRKLEAMFASARSPQASARANPPRLIVGAAGRLSPEKGYSVLVDAAAQVLASSQEASIGFVLFGDGPLRSALRSQIEARGLQGRFHLAGFHSDLDKFFPQFDLFVLPSYTEGLPNVVLEAFAAGVPVVATAVGGTPEVVRDGVNGHLVAAGDPAALAGRIADMLAAPDRRHAMGDCGRRDVQQEFSFARQAEQYARLFRQLIPACGTADYHGRGRALSKESAE